VVVDRLPRGPARRRQEADGGDRRRARAIKDEFGDERRTEIVEAEGEILTESLIDQEDMVVTRTRLGYVKRTPLKEYQAQGRGGRGITGAAQGGDDDFVADMFAASTHDHLLLFTSKGRAYYKKVYELPEGARTSKGKPFVNVIELQDGEEVVSMLPLKEFSEDRFVFLATESGTVKKTELTAFEKIRVTGIRAISLDDTDRLVSVAITSANHDVLLTSAKGLAVRFRDDKVRAMGRDAGGVRGMKLGTGDRLVGMVAFERDSGVTLITVCARGYGKRTSLGDYPTKNRGGKGVITIKTTSRNGLVAAVRIVADDDHLILISDKGKIIRLRVKDIPTQGRATQGVRVMRLDDGESGRRDRAPGRPVRREHRGGRADRGRRRRRHRADGRQRARGRGRRRGRRGRRRRGRRRRRRRGLIAVSRRCRRLTAPPPARGRGSSARTG
jgi:DNA gyrase subunit A